MRSGPTPETDRLTPARGICECEDHFKVEECKGKTVSSISGSLDWTLKGGGGFNRGLFRHYFSHIVAIFLEAFNWLI